MGGRRLRATVDWDQVFLRYSRGWLQTESIAMQKNWLENKLLHEKPVYLVLTPDTLF